MAPQPLYGQDISYKNNNTITQDIVNKSNDVVDELDYKEINFVIYIPILIVFTMYIIISLILFILGKKAKLMIIRDISIYIYNTISIFCIVCILLLDAASSSHSDFRIPCIFNILICAYMIPIWIYTNIIRVEKMECRLKIQNARLNTSDKYRNVNPNLALHNYLKKFQFYENWSNLFIAIIIFIISAIVIIIYIINPSIFDDNEYTKTLCIWAIFMAIFICMLYDLYKVFRMKYFKENVGVLKELNYIILNGIICSVLFLIFYFIPSVNQYIPVAVWQVIYFIIFHSVTVVKPVFAVQVYKSKVELLHEELLNETQKTKTNEMEIENFEQVLNPKSSLYNKFKNFLVAEVCIENLLFYETIISLLLKYQKDQPTIKDNSRRSSYHDLNTTSRNSWNFIRFFNKSRNSKSFDNQSGSRSNSNSTLFEEKVFKTSPYTKLDEDASTLDETKTVQLPSSHPSSFISYTMNSYSTTSGTLSTKSHINSIMVSNINTTMTNTNTNTNPNTNSNTNNNLEVSLPISSPQVPFYEKLYDSLDIPEISQELTYQLIDIYQNFIPEGSEYQLNLTSDLRKSVEQQMSNNQISITIFKPVVKEVFELLRWTNYPRFLQKERENNQY